MKTLAAILVSTSSPLEVDEIEIPRLLKGQILVEISFSGVCGTQVMEVDGKRGVDKWLPHCLGHEAIGKVIEKHSSVQKVVEGDQVILSWIKSKGIEAGGCTYNWKGRTVNAGAVTTFQKHAVVSENRIVKMNVAKLQSDHVLLGCAAPTGMGSIIKVLKASSKNSLIIFGAGGIGLCAFLAAKEYGLSPIFIVDTSDKRLEMAKKLGANLTINPTRDEFNTNLKDMFGSSVDFAIDASGNVGVMEQLLKHVKPQGGKAVVIGNAPFESKFKVSPSELNKGKSLLGTWGGDADLEEDLRVFLEILNKNIKKLQALDKKYYPLSEINSAIDAMRQKIYVRPIIDLSL